MKGKDQAYTKLENKILDILKNLSIDFVQTDNYTNQWRNKKFYLDYVYYDGREVKIEEVKNLIMDEIIKEVNMKKLTILKQK